jgi:hypothetical protein
VRAQRWRVVPLLLGCLVLCSGCNAQGRRALGGSVTFQDRPVDHGTITFLTTSGPPGRVGGGLIRKGRYDIPAAQGLEPGVYRVAISAPGPGGTLSPEEIAAGASAKARETLPAAYNTESTLTIEVKANGSTQFDFHLK